MVHEHVDSPALQGLGHLLGARAALDEHEALLAEGQAGDRRRGFLD
jgi:hypothetical protein